jgi:predicted TPR repeat methyltransferase
VSYGGDMNKPKAHWFSRDFLPWWADSDQRFIDCLRIERPLSQLSPDEVEQLCVARLTSHYDSCDWRFTRGTLRVLLRKLAKLGKQDHIIDFGCGDGIIADILRSNQDLLPESKISGFDTSQFAIEQARRRASMGEMHKRISFDHLDLTSRSAQPLFSGGIANFVMHFDIADEYIQWLSQSIRNGGYFIYNDYQYPHDRVHYERTKQRFFEHGLTLVKERPFFRRRKGKGIRAQMLIVLRKVPAESAE